MHESDDFIQFELSLSDAKLLNGHVRLENIPVFSFANLSSKSRCSSSCHQQDSPMRVFSRNSGGSSLEIDIFHTK